MFVLKKIQIVLNSSDTFDIIMKLVSVREWITAGMNTDRIIVINIQTHTYKHIHISFCFKFSIFC